MARVSQWCFAPFRLDVTNACVWRDGAMIALPPKPLAVLTYLVLHAGQLVRKETLLEAAWPETAVGDAVLKTCMSQIRKALGDTAQSPQFVATVHRQGYRFIASVTPVDADSPAPIAEVGGVALPGFRPSGSSLTADSSARLVEREAVFASLHGRLVQASQGQRQVVFLSGEAGIGKTSVVEAFVTQAATVRQVRCAAGQCVEHYGAGEAYLPVLEALGRLCRGPEGSRVIALMRQHAPTWLVQMPWLLTPSDRALLHHELRGATRERMLRELAEALEVLSAESPLVLVLEDLHWSDYATLDAIAMLARRQEPARLLVLGTYRPVEAIVSEHPLRTVIQTLRLHGQCAEYALALLSARAVTAYLSAHFPHHQFPELFSQVLYHRTDGNPLFLTTMTASLLRQGMIGRQGGHWVLKTTLDAIEAQVPEGLQSMIAQQLDLLLPQEQQTVEAGSTVGVEFSAAAVAAAIEEDLGQVEARCERLARQQLFVRPAGLDTWPDGTVAARYRFIHSLYQHVAYQRLGAGQRVQRHRRITARLEAAYEGQTREIATELARHATQGHDMSRAVHFLLQAAEHAMQRYAHRDAYDHLKTGLELLQTLPSTPEQTQRELAYLMVLRVVLGTLKGFRAPEMAPVLRRVQELYPQVEDLPASAMGYWMGIWVWHLQRSESLQTAKDVAERYLAIAQYQHNQVHVLRASQALGASLLVLGAPTLAREHLERAISMYDPAQHNPAVIDTTQDHGVSSLCWMAWMWWLLGYPDQALQRVQEALALAQQLAHPYSLAFALGHLARHHLYRGEYRKAQERAESQMVLATKQQFPAMIRQSTMLRGAAIAFQGQMTDGIRQMRQVFATGFGSSTAFIPRELAVLADAYGRVGQPVQGLALINEALAIVAQSDSHYYEAELYRLKGELVLRQNSPDEPRATQCFVHALDIARQQQAKTWELRAAVSLCRLWQEQGKQEEARALLAPIYDRFTEGFDTADLRDAKRLLDEFV